jgi:hypothetical protein
MQCVRRIKYLRETKYSKGKEALSEIPARSNDVPLFHGRRFWNSLRLYSCVNSRDRICTAQDSSPGCAMEGESFLAVWNPLRKIDSPSNLHGQWFPMRSREQVDP